LALTYWLLLALAAVTCIYHFIAALAALFHLRRTVAFSSGGFAPALSILKPVRGLDPHFLEAIRSHAAQDYAGEMEMLFGVADAADPSVAVIEQLAREFPHRAIRVIHCTAAAPNGKVAVLMDLERHARHGVLLVNDSDIRVPAGYLRDVVAPLADAGNGVVTCLYRARGDSLSAWWEALGIAIDFAPSVLVAPWVGIREFGLGATLVFRRAELDRIGGFAALAPYLADDYQLAKRITRLGLRAHMSPVVVETSLGDDTWAGVWAHQVRWARTIRVSRGDGYPGLPVTHAGVWALLAAVTGHYGVAMAIVLVRSISAWMAAGGVLRSPVAWFFWLAPLWDLWAFAVWLTGLTGQTVKWRDRRLWLDGEGRIIGRE